MLARATWEKTFWGNKKKKKVITDKLYAFSLISGRREIWWRDAFWFKNY